MGPEEFLDVKGMRAEMMFFRGTLDKLGVQIEVEHMGKYKDFGDMFTRKDMSPETKEVMNSVLDDAYGRLLATIAAGRKKSVERDSRRDRRGSVPGGAGGFQGIHRLADV